MKCGSKTCQNYDGTCDGSRILKTKKNIVMLLSSFLAQCVDAGLTGCCTGAGAGGISCGPYTNSTGGNCYCDASCHTYDDCCDNIEYTCPTPTAS